MQSKNIPTKLGIVMGAILITVLVLTGLPAKPVYAVTFDLYVATTGSDAGPNNCQTQGSPCKTITHAMGQAASGDRINIAGGTYTENITITKNLSFVGDARDTTILDGGGIGRTVSIFSGYTVSFTTLTIQNGYIASGGGGGIYNAGDLTLDRVMLKNSAADYGGGIFSTSHSLTITDTIIQNNQANTAPSVHGGGIFIHGVNPVTITNSTISGNTATGYSGGIHVQESSAVSFTNVTISGNTASGNFGGGVTITSPASATFLNSTITDNHLLSGTNGGGIYSDGTLSFRNTIVAGNDANNCSPHGTWTSQGHNLESDTTCNFTQAGDLQNTIPLLFRLGDNGGYSLTHSLQETSPAIDGGDDGYCPSTDGRGYDRITRNHCDIGAFEMDNSAPTDISLSSTSVDERLPVGTTVGTLTTTDIDVLQSQTYSMTCATPGGNEASFTILGDQLNTAAVFDYETKNTYAICIRTDDGHGGTYDRNFNINVTDLFEGTSTFRSVGTFDGHILKSGENTNVGGTLDSTAGTFILGDGAQDKQYRAILHFNTGPLPDNAVITKVTLKIRRQGLVGTNPFTILNGLKVDMRKPYFGTTLGLVISDFQTAAGKNVVALFGVTPVNYWYSANLNAIGRAYLNKTGYTQFRLRFGLDDNNDNAADYMRFCSGNYAILAARPTLVVEYYVP